MFKELLTFLGAVQQNVLTSSATAKDIALAAGKWFTGERDQGGKRAEREKREKERRLHQEGETN